MRRVGRAAAFAAVVLTAVGLSTTSADAAVVFGSNLAASPNTEVCVGGETSCTYTNSTLAPADTAPGGVRAPIDGVIVSWRVRSGKSIVTSPLRLRVIHEGGTGGGGSAAEALPKVAATHSYSTRLAVRKGDLLGIDVLESNSMFGPEIASYPHPETLYSFWIPALIEGQTRPAKIAQDIEYLINATVEPDADGDGFGDETQDACPTLIGPAACPLPLRPDTLITKGPSGAIHGHRATFRFRSDPAGAGFECKLDKGRFKTCKPPKKYQHLSPGKHKFSVRAFNSAGRDPFPATRSFRVEP
jgi:hypothetical protein